MADAVCSGATERARRTSRSGTAIAAATLVLVGLVAPLTLPSVASAQSDVPSAVDPDNPANPFALVERLQLQNATGGTATLSQSAVVDDRGRRIYSYFLNHLVVIDLDRMEQAGAFALSLGGRGAAAFDPDRRWLFLAQQTATADGQIAVVEVGDGEPEVLSDDPLPGLPAEQILSLAYHRASSTLYALTGHLDVGDVLNLGAPVTARSPSVRAFSVSGEGSLSQMWAYEVRACSGMMTDRRAGSLSFLGVNDAGDELYFPCRGLGAPAPVPVFGQKATSSGALVLSIGEPVHRGDGQAIVGDAGTELGPVGTTDVRSAFFPVAGDLSDGMIFGDRVNDRMVFHSRGKGARLYVFDVRHRAWVGSMLSGERNIAAGVADPATGRVYQFFDAPRDEDGVRRGLRVADAGVVPAGIGAYYDPGFRPDTCCPGNVLFDPVARRLIFHASTQVTDHSGLWFLEDRTPPVLPSPPRDPDAGTHDIDEELASQVNHTGEASAYGARILWAGGVGALPVFELHRDEGVMEDFWENFPPELAEHLPHEGHRGLFLGQVAGAQLSGDKASGDATATATSAVIDGDTAEELRARYGFATDRFISSDDQGDGADNGAAECEPGEPNASCLTYDELTDRVGHLSASSCSDLGDPDDPRDSARAGSRATCRSQEEVAAWASNQGESLDQLPVRVGHAESSVRSYLDPERGVVTVSEAAARDIAVTMPGVGALHLGEVWTRAETWAQGRPGTADSTLDWGVNRAHVKDASGETVYACGFEGSTDDPDGDCDPHQLEAEINERFPSRLLVRGPRPDTTERVTGSPRGARAAIRKDEYASANDSGVNFDDQEEVSGLEIILYSDGYQANRLIVQLAAVYAESQYRIGAPATPAEPVGPASLVIELLDDVGEALAGGMFEVRAAGDLPDAPEPLADPDGVEGDPDDGDGAANGDGTDGSDGDGANGDGTNGDGANGEGTSGDGANGDGTNGDGFDAASTDDNGANGDGNGGGDGGLDDPLGGVPGGLDGELVDGAVCITGDDGIGDCVFEDLEPGRYQVTQTAAPDGYFPSEPFVVDASPGFDTVVTFTNFRAVGGIEINLTDDGDPPEPLAGGEFALLAGGSDEVARCTTGPEGTCGFADVALDDYVVRQVAAPEGYLTADDIAFALAQPGQVAVLSIVNGLEGIEATTTAAPAAPSLPRVEPVSFRPGPTPPPPVVRQTPSAPPRSGGLGQILAAPGQVLGFIARRPGEAALIVGVWLLFAAPAYLAARRRSLVIAKGVM